MSRFRRALILGCAGGIGAVLVRLLTSHPAGRKLAGGIEGLWLLDEVLTQPPDVPAAYVLPPRRIDDPGELRDVLVRNGIDQVVDLGDLDTLALSRVCASVGADYVSASLQRRDLPPDDIEGRIMIASRVLVPGRRPDVGSVSHLIGAGMNPGIVNALVVAGLEELARRVGAEPTVQALDVHAIYVTEQDTTTAVEGVAGDVFPMSWSPQDALDEFLEPSAMYVTGGEIAQLPHRSPDRLYRARCGDHEIDGMIVPHEEIVTIGARYPTVETAFVYAIPRAAMAALRARPHRKPDDWRRYRLYPPHHATALQGYDRVGVLIASRRHGELWVGFESTVADGARHGTNGTLLQAAAGVLAGWALLGSVSGFHVVDDLDPHAYLAIAEEVLGPRRVVHVPGATPRKLRDRQRNVAAVSSDSRSRAPRWDGG